MQGGYNDSDVMQVHVAAVIPAEDLTEDSQLAAAVRDSLLEGDIHQYEESHEQIQTDQEIARQLQEQLNETGGRGAVRMTESMYDRQQEILRKKTYSGAYYGTDSNVRPWFTYFIIFLCTGLMVVELLVNNSLEGRPADDLALNPLYGPSIETLLFLGAKRTDLIVEEGDFWRLIMSIFLHGGVIHLIFNMLFLYSFGTGLEIEFGHSRVAYIFLTSGFFGVLCSAIFNPTIPSVGASGACYGLIGAAWADLWLNFGYYKKTKWKTWMCQLAFGTVLNIALGLIPQLDNFAHLGGLVAGFFTGLTVLTLPRYDGLEQLKPDKCYQIVLKAFAILLVPFAIVVGLIVLYVGVDVNSYCPWCQYLSCAPINLWECEISCSEDFTLEFQGSGVNRTVTITCPRDIGDFTFDSTDTELESDEAVQFEFCEEACL